MVDHTETICGGFLGIFELLLGFGDLFLALGDGVIRRVETPELLIAALLTLARALFLVVLYLCVVDFFLSFFTSFFERLFSLLCCLLCLI